MTERITDAELREIEEPGLDGFGPVRRVFAERLVREIRRLRGLIERTWPTDKGEPLLFSHPRYMDAIRAAEELQAEARAIREEQK